MHFTKLLWRKNEMNPILFRQGICDPHAHVFEGKVYVYATHDSPGYEEGFHMEDWQIWSSEDLIQWKQEAVLLPEDFYCGHIDQCWAVDAAQKNGKYYWYFSTGDWGVGVGVSDHPARPFTDALGGPLVDYRTEPVNCPKWDPCVFQDEDGVSYLIVGECRLPKPWDCYFIARLNDDMVSLAEPLRRIEYPDNPCPEDKPSIHKYGGRYYLTHSSYYAVSDRVYGPYRHLGNMDCNIDHGSFFTYLNQTYFASGGMDNPNRYLRASYIAPCHYKNDGRIVVDQKIMEYGCGQYDAAWKQIESRWYFSASRECKRELPEGGFAVELREGEWVSFPHITNIEENTKIQFQCRSLLSGKSAFLEIREGDSQGTLLGICKIGEQGVSGLFETTLTCPAGMKSLTFCAKGEILMEWFSFDNGKNRSTAEPASSFVGRGAARIYDENAGCCRALGNMELKGASMEGLLDGGAGGRGELVIPYYCKDMEGELELCINGVYQETLKFPHNGRTSIGKVPSQLRVPVTVKPGVNKISLSSSRYQFGTLGIDHLTLEMEKSACRTYPAANGALSPVGNGCWDKLPQRENDYFAFGARVVKFLEKPGDSVSVRNIDGGKGGTFGLEIRYSRGEAAPSFYELEVNGKLQETLCFAGTKSFSMREAEVLKTSVELFPGERNVLVLRKCRCEDLGIFVDSFAIVPF